jgi:hypothetical protein
VIVRVAVRVDVDGMFFLIEVLLGVLVAVRVFVNVRVFVAVRVNDAVAEGTRVAIVREYVISKLTG